MKNLFLHVLRITAGIALPFGTFFVAILATSMVISPPLTFYQALLIIVPLLIVTMILFVLPILALLLVHPKEIPKGRDQAEVVSEAKSIFLMRPIYGSLIPIIILIAIGIIPFVYVMHVAMKLFFLGIQN
jgi:hypothetical protein